MSTIGIGREIPGGPVQLQSNLPSVTEQVRVMEELTVDGETLLTVSSVKVMGGGGSGRVTASGKDLE